MSNENALQKANKKKKQHLLLSVVLDALGMATYLIPALGETGDAIFAPIYGLAIFGMYRRKAFPAAVGGIVGMIEEFLPGTDIIPTATIMWAYTYLLNKDKDIDALDEPDQNT